MDPFTEEDALQEARLSEVVFDAVHARAGLLLDLRGALQLRMAYTGLLVLEGVERFSWAGERRTTIRTAWNVVGSVPINKDGVVNLRLLFFPDAELTVVGRNEEVAAGMASMDSLFEPTQATFI